MRFYVARNGETVGPYSVAQIQERLASGFLDSEMLGCTEGNSEWEPMGKLLGFGSRRPADVQSANDPARAAAQTPGRDDILLQKGAFIVSRTRFVVGDQVYATRNIVSVQLRERPPQHGGALMLIALGLIICATGFSREDFHILIGGGAVLTALGCASFLYQHTRYSVVWTTASGQVQSATDRNGHLIRSIALTLQEAMTSLHQ